MSFPPFLDLPPVDARQADVLLLPLPFEGTVSYGRGTAAAPAAIWHAATQIELWDEQVDFHLDQLGYFSAAPLRPKPGKLIDRYFERVRREAAALHAHGGLVIGVGGEHSLTPPLVSAAAGRDDLTGVTVVQLDAHADLRDHYDGTPHSHACAMRRLVERGARLIAIGIRSADFDEFEYGRSTGRVETFSAARLAKEPEARATLHDRLATLSGEVYLTIDIDALEVHLSPATGTPQPGGLGWWEACDLLQSLLRRNRAKRLLGCDLVETVPASGTLVNQMVAARLLTKVNDYQFGPR